MLSGPDSATEAAGLSADVVLNGMTGSIGLRPTLAALQAGSTLALANKESLIAGGPLVKAAAAPGQLVPVDSEHSALAQCLRGGSAAEVRRLVLTASGGPFRGRTRAELADVTPEQALAHPTWTMGPVVTTNSATLVNKGLELIEAHLLFDLPFDRIEVVVHPQSVIHSMVEFCDGSTIAQASPPDMRLPIALGLSWPERVADAAPACDWTTAATWTFAPLDHDAFPAVALARRAGEAGGTAPAVYNAANEELVEAFLGRRLPFLAIVDTLAARRRGAPGEHLREPPHRRGRPSRRGLGPVACPRDHRGSRMTLLLEMLGWVIFLVGVGFSIGMHEIGHLLPAKKFGVKVTQYMVGFGPTIWSRHKGETEYGVKAVPVGGYIRMIGMYPPARGGDDTMLRASSTGRFSTLIDDARKQSLEEVTPADANRVFYKLPVRQRIVVMLGGPTMNLILAVIMTAIVLCGIGVYKPTTTVGAVVACVPTSTNLTGSADASGSCAPGNPSPAAAGGLRVNDTIVEFDDIPVATWEDAQAAIKNAQPGATPVVVDRGGERITLTVPLAAAPRPVYDEDGKDTGTVETRNFLGIAPAGVREALPLSAVPTFIWDNTVRAVKTIATLPARLVDLTRQLFTDEPRDPQGIVGPVGVGRITGEIVALEETPVIDKVAGVLGLLAGLNLFLFLFNLIPLLPLDGGHVAGAIWESIKRASRGSPAVRIPVPSTSRRPSRSPTPCRSASSSWVASCSWRTS